MYTVNFNYVHLHSLPLNPPGSSHVSFNIILLFYITYWVQLALPIYRLCGNIH